MTGIRAHTDGAAASASAAMGARAFARGNDIVFGSAPDLHTAGHEAAHVVQQRAGVHLKGGVGQAGDVYERHADAVADTVVTGGNAEALLSTMAGTPGAGCAPSSGGYVQRQEPPQPQQQVGQQQVGQGPKPLTEAEVYRDGDLHYPSETEQQQIEHLLGRNFSQDPTAAQPNPPGGAAQPVVRRGRALTEPDRRALADRLMPAFYTTLDEFEPPPQLRTTVASDAEAMALAARARKGIYEQFGSYIDRQVSLTATDTSQEDREAKDQVVVSYGTGPHDDLALARTIIESNCTTCRDAVGGLDDASKVVVMKRMIETALAERGPQLRSAGRARVGGSYLYEERRLRIGQYTSDPYGTAVHELIHALAHPVFYAAFIDERSIIEGFTEYFAREIVGERKTPYDDVVGRVHSVRGAMSGPFLFGGDAAAAEESLRLAYFRGRLELIGWKPSGPDEDKAVKEAGGATPWDPNTARSHEKAFQRRLREAQDPHRNVIVTRIYLRDGGETIGVRYARILLRSEPLARSQLLLEGQLFGSPIDDPRRLGASIGLGIEYQEPYFYAQGGLRLIGSGALSGVSDARVDVSPFVGVGARLWQRVRVGPEAFVLLPLTGQAPQLGGGVSVNVELW